MKVFVAGATGVLGRPLVRALSAAGHDVTGTTRSPAKVAGIAADGGTGVVCDALDRGAVHEAVAAAAPEVVVHQLTDLPASYAKLRKGSPGTNRLRTEGTQHLVEAAVAAGARRVIAESIAFLYEPTGPLVVDETAPPWPDAPPPYGDMMRALRELERTVTSTPGIEGVVLRYGTLYGPGTWFARDGDITRQVRRRMLPIVGGGGGLTSFLHVDDAAAATVRALDSGAPGIYNVTDDEPVSYAEFLPAFAQLVGAKPPFGIPAWPVRLLAGKIAVATLTAQRGAANAKAKTGLGWQLRYASWRDGFAAEFG